MIRTKPLAFVATLVILPLASALADSHVLGVPVLNSRPGAAYTLYLDVAGFNFTGSWLNVSPPSGTAALAFNGISTGSFTTAEIADIANFWAHTANAYAPFNVNVTTVDPAVAAGQADTDAHRQAWYDTQARVMHTIITSNTVWDGGNGGRSKLGVLNKTYNPTGINGGAGGGNHTNWVFDFLHQGPDELIDYRNVVHENGHAFGLSHQSDFGAGGAEEYSFGDDDYAPYMGGAFFAKRATWRVGTKNNGAIQNDMQMLAAIPGLDGFVADGIGHTRLTATSLPVTGGAVDASQAKGIIVPLSAAVPAAIGAGNYTTDVWSFVSSGINAINLNVIDGNELLAIGVADPGATLRSTLNIFDALGGLVGVGAESADTMSESFTGVLPAGTYYAEVGSFGGYTQTSEIFSYSTGTFWTAATTYYFDAGSYFMTGSGFAAVPEPTSFGLLAVAILGFLGRRRFPAP